MVGNINYARRPEKTFTVYVYIYYENVVGFYFYKSFHAVWNVSQSYHASNAFADFPKHAKKYASYRNNPAFTQIN